MILLCESKKIVFLSKAPRPSEKVKQFLKKLKMEEKYLKNVITSGEAAMHAINENRFGKLTNQATYMSFFHHKKKFFPLFTDMGRGPTWKKPKKKIILNITPKRKW